METVTQNLKNLSLETSNKAIPFHKTSPWNIQKCFVPRNTLKLFSLQVGDLAVVSNVSKKFVCKIYSENYSTLVYFDSSVEYLNSKPEKSLDFDVVDIAKPHSSINIDVIFNTFQSKNKWDLDRSSLCTILKRYILNAYYFCGGCKIKLNDNDVAKKMDLLSVVVNAVEIDSFSSTNQRTVIIINKTLTKQQIVDDSNLNTVVGCDNVKKDIREIIECNYLYFKSKGDSCLFLPTKQVLLTGPSGCGKSALVQDIASEAKCTIVKLASHSIVNSNSGETENTLRGYFNQAINCAQSDGRCILHLDDFEVLCQKRSLKTGHSKRVSSSLLQLLDDANDVLGLVIIATSNCPENIDLSARRQGRLELELNISPPNEEQRNEIILHFMKSMLPRIEKETAKRLSLEVAAMTQGYVGVDLKYVCQNVAKNVKNQEDGFIYINLFKDALKSVMPSSLRSDITFTLKENISDEIGGLEDIKQKIDRFVWWPLIHKDAFQRMGITRPKGILLYGPPGCAKTTLVRNFASLRGLALLTVSPAELYSPYVGEAEKTLANLFAKARQNAPCLLFLDEIDALVGGRDFDSTKSSDVHSRVLATLLMEMDGVGIIKKSRIVSSDPTFNGDDGVTVIAATNKPSCIDAALLRPGRFDKHIHVPLPNFEARLDILEKLTKNIKLAPNVHIHEIAAKTEGFSGADMKNLYNESALYAMKCDGVNVESLQMHHFKTALVLLRRSVSHQTDGKLIKE